MVYFPRQTVRWLFLACLFLAGPGDAQSVLWDLEYAKVNNQSLRLDLYLPADYHGMPRPLVVYFHSGGWNSGNKSEAIFSAPNLLLRKFALASVNYRLSFQAKFPAQIHDCKGALRWLRANAGKYNLDPERIAAAGASAGGHLAALLGTSGGVAALEGTVGGNLNQSSRVQAVVDYYGLTDFWQVNDWHLAATSYESQLLGKSLGEIHINRAVPAYAPWVKLVDQISPVSFITQDDPPFYIAHGDQDGVVELRQSQRFFQALTGMGVPATLRVVPGSGHGLPVAEELRAWDFLSRELRSASGFRVYGSGCKGGSGVAALTHAPGNWPVLGGNFTMHVSNVAPGAMAMMLGGSWKTVWSGTPLPLGLASMGYPGCSLYVCPLQVLPMTVKGGIARVSIPVPVNTALVGGRAQFQGIATDPVTGMIFSNPAKVVVGF